MGTRGAIGFVVDGQEKIAYNQFDSYPDGVGLAVATFCAAHPAEEITRIARAIQIIDSSVPPTSEQKRECAAFTNLRVSNQSDDDWYCLLREAQGELEPYAQGLRYMSDNKAFLADSLFCEYAYIVNCDTGKLEFYKGFNQDPKATGRYAALKRADERDSGYFGVKLVKEYPLSDIKDADAIVKDMNAAADPEAEAA
jgi:hypothetical protein